MLFVILALIARADGEKIEFRSYGPGTLGTDGLSGVRVEAFVPANPALIEGSIQLFSMEDGDRRLRDSEESDFSIRRQALCTLKDNGDSRDGDSTAGDDVYSCVAWVRPKRPGKLRLVIQAKFGPRVNGKLLHIKIVHTQEAAINVISGQVKAEVEADHRRTEIMKEARRILQQMIAKHGKTDRAQAATVREIREIEGVRDAKLNTSGDLFIYFDAGGHDQLFTFEPGR